MTLADIYALVEIKADHEKIERRNKALSSAVTQIAKDGVKPLAQLGVLVLGGTPGDDVGWFVQAVHVEDQAFSVVSNEFELQVLALALLGLVLQQSETLRKQKNLQTAVRVAAVLTYGIHPQIQHRKIHPGFQKVALEMCQDAATLLETQARDLRNRSASTTLAKVDPSLPAATDATFPEAVKKALNDLHGAFAQTISTMRRESMADREELDILWWLQTGFSKRIEKPLSEVDANLAWAEIAEDAAALVNIPPALATIPVIETVIRRFVPKPEENLKAGDLVGVKLEKPTVALAIAGDYPRLFPSLTATQGVLNQAAWTDQTGLRGSTKLTIIDWALWHYKQRALERILSEAFHAR